MRERNQQAAHHAAAIPDVVEEHFEELDFLWEQRELVLFDPDWTFEDLAEHDERCEAHLDGLRIAGEHAVELALPALDGEERGAALAATLVLLAFGRPDFDDKVLDALARVEDPLRDGVRLGLRHSDLARLADRIVGLAASGDPAVRVAALDVLAFHRMPAPPGTEGFFHLLDGPARVRLYPALGRFGGPWSVRDLDRALAEEDPSAARLALEASARVGVDGLAERCRTAVRGRAPGSRPALEFLGVVGDTDDFDLLAGAIDDDGTAAAAVAAFGALGDVRAVPLLIEAMTRNEISAAAGRAFRRITGAPDVDADEPLPPPDGLSEDEMEFHEPEVPADPDRAREWWESHRGRFDDGGLWQAGHDLADDPLGEAFDALPLPSRRDIYLGFRSGDPTGVPDLELEERAHLQVRRRSSLC